MPSKLQLKYKKTIKEAEFAYADLEYHRDVAHEAKIEFRLAIEKLLQTAGPELRELIRSKEEERLAATITELQELANSTTESVEKEGTAPSAKATELRSLFRKIAEETHPDKLVTKDLSLSQIEQYIKLFKKAKKALTDTNWYTLHCIALDLGIDLPPPSEEQILWVEQDIKRIKEELNDIQNLTAWHWYNGDDTQKQAALKHFFQQIYGVDHPDL